jgi:hypothetical protein
MVKVLLIILVIAVLLEDGSSIKKTEEERKEDRELAEKVNATLAEEEKERQEEEEKEKKRDKENAKKEGDENQSKKEDKKKEDLGKDGAKGGTFPIVECPTPVECPKEKACPELKECPVQEVCPEVEPCQPCGPCPPIHCQPCPICNGTSGDRPIVANVTRLDCPSEPASPGMTVPVAMIVGASASLLVTGMVAILGLLLRYAPPLISGFLFLFLVALTWYLSSHYPETARELGGRVVATLREATIALGHRVLEVTQHHQDQVGVPTKPNLFLI